ncbi:MAG: hypothetical protein EBR38_03460 [Flavobacteriaceae bacterium]|nr:hypothetical protein [Flavobacteriaceae bacterium]
MTKIRISNKDFHFQIPSKSGIYKIYSIDERDKPKHLQRLLGIDQEGILYIGKSENLKDRVRMLWRVLQPNYNATAHTFGLNYKSLLSIQTEFPLETLAIEFEENDNAKIFEKEILENYRQLYGEVPPLNSSK